ncbi:MAG: hypothetical protein GY938_31725 [Ketobacter sp.]|nr:hypothetical protein [Ketobacter sp.]
MTYISSNSNITCNKCSSDIQIVTDRVTDDSVNFCFQVNIIENCDAYSMATSIHASTLVCTSCTADFYLDSTNNLCKERKNKPNNCTEYVEDADKCSKCGNSTYIEPTGTECTVFPSGIKGCEIFSNLTTCTKCKPSYYLDNNTCISITTVITNCEYYADATNCSECNSTWIVEAGQCVKANATGCVTWTDINRCATCQTQFGIYEDPNNSGVFNCQRISDSRCTTFDINNPDVCQICQNNYYPNSENLCTNVTAGIPDCQAYDSATTCSRCLKGTVLAKDKKSCHKSGSYTSNIAGSCYEAVENTDAICTFCNPGNYFSQGTCVACSSNTINDGCAFCDPLDNAKCMLCTTGFFQDKDGACHDDGTITKPEEPKEPVSVFINTIAFICSLMMFLF